MIDYFDRPIFVVGLPRSGTSLVAGCLQACGAWTGTTVPGTEANPKGFYEHAQIREGVVKRMLVQLQCDPLGVRKLTPVDLKVRVPELKSVIRQIVDADGYHHDRPWLYKGAKLTLLWPIFSQAFPTARWVIVRRNRREVIDSCLRTTFMRQHSNDPKFWQAFVDEYLKRLARLKRSGARCFEIWPGRMLQGDYRHFRTLLARLELPFDSNAVQAFISPEFWHG